jgi:hypothetical protein
MWAVGGVCIVGTAVVTVVLVRLWSKVDQNFAGWITTFVAFAAAYAVWEALSDPRDEESVGSGDIGDGPWTAP